MVNDAIDTPFAGTNFFDALLENEEYLEKYHSYLRQLVEEYIEGGKLDEVYTRIRNQIDELVKDDPTAFYSFEEYQNASDTLYQTIRLRAQSIQGQLDGTIPSTDAGQRQDSSHLIDATGIDIKSMGQFDMGMGRNTGDSKQENGSSSSSFPGGFDMSNKPEGFTPGSMPEGGFDTSKLPEGFSPSDMPDNSDFSQMTPGSMNKSSGMNNSVLFALCLVAMVAGLFLVKTYKRQFR